MRLLSLIGRVDMLPRMSESRMKVSYEKQKTKHTYPASRAANGDI